MTEVLFFKKKRKKNSTEMLQWRFFYTHLETLEQEYQWETFGSRIAGSRSVQIYNVKVNVKLSFPEDAPILHSAINIGQESLHPHLWRRIADTFRCESGDSSVFICMSLNVSEVWVNEKHFSCAYGYLQLFSLNCLFMPLTHFSINLLAFLLLNCKT